MDIVEKIERNRDKILLELYEWAETFDMELDEDGELTKEPYIEVFELAERFEHGLCTKDDYINILFHIEQINYDEIKINL